MKITRLTNSAHPASLHEVAQLRTRLADAEETLRAIRSGEVDTVMVAGKEGSQVFTLDGAEHAYRLLIESMNEGALILIRDKTILYANQCFARMVKSPLEQVMGRFVSGAAGARPGLWRRESGARNCPSPVPAGSSPCGRNTGWRRGSSCP